MRQVLSFLHRTDLHGKYVIMLAPDIKGGILTLVNSYRDSSLSERWSIEYIYTYGTMSKIKRLIKYSKGLLRFVCYIAHGQVSLVHAHVSQRGSFYRKAIFILLSKMFNIPVIFHLHGSEFKQFYEKSWKVCQLFIRNILNLSDRVIVLSSQWEHYLVRTVRVKSAILKLFNYVPFIAFTDDLSPKKEDDTLLFMGEIGRRKGIFDLLKVISRLVASFPRLHLYCCGNGELEQLRMVAEELEVDKHIEIKGWITGELKRELLTKSTIFVLPSYNEGLPMALLEAMAANLPIVSTCVGGIPDAIGDGLEGILIEPGDLDALEAAIRRLLSDINLRTNMGVAARQKYEKRFAPGKVLPILEQLYHELS